MTSRRLLFVGLLAFALILIVLVFVQQRPPLPDDQLAGSIVDATVQTTENTLGTLGTFLNRLITAPHSPIVRVLLIVAGIALLLAGWRIYDYVIVIAGVVVGATVAMSLLTTDNTVAIVAAIIVGGLLGAALGVFLYYVAVFVIGAYIGIAFTGALITMISTTPPSELVLLIGGVIGGLVLIGLSFQFLVVLASLVGAEMLALGLGLPLIWTVIFTVVGVVIQLGLMRTYNYDFRGRRRTVIVA